MDVTVRSCPLEGVLLIETPLFQDERGFFLESYNRRRFAGLGIPDEFVQDNHSQSRRGVLRGFHYQDMSAPMGKLVRCTRGTVLDVVVDLRVGSPTFGRWLAEELSDENRLQLWVPVGFGHAFLAMSEIADVQYKCSGYYTPAAEGVLAWDDPGVGVRWPLDRPRVSDRDRQGMSLRDYVKRPAFRYTSSPPG